MVAKLVEYHRHSDAISRCFTSTLKMINADQPKADVFSQGKDRLQCVCVLINKFYRYQFGNSGGWNLQWMKQTHFYDKLIHLLFAIPAVAMLSDFSAESSYGMFILTNFNPCLSKDVFVWRAWKFLMHIFHIVLTENEDIVLLEREFSFLQFYM